MRLISSKLTFVTKRVFPWLWFGTLGLVVILMLVLPPTSGSFPPAAIAIPVIMAAFGYLMMRKLVFDLMDEVWDAGDALVVKNDGAEDRIPLAAIMNVGYTVLVNPPRVTLTLRQPCRFGTEVTFSPPRKSFVLFAKSPLIAELIARVDAARRRTPA